MAVKSILSYFSTFIPLFHSKSLVSSIQIKRKMKVERDFVVTFFQKINGLMPVFFSLMNILSIYILY